MDNVHAHSSSPGTPSRSRPPRNYHGRSLSNSALPSRQQRLLPNHNAKFAMKELAVSGLSTRLFRLSRPSENEQTDSGRQEEKTDGTGEKDDEQALGLSSSLGILDEITNSASRPARSLRKRGPIPVFQDHTPEHRVGDHSTLISPSICSRASIEIKSFPSPLPPPDGPDDIGLREVSGNVQRGPSPSHGGSVKDGYGRRPMPSQSRFNSSEDIEDIDQELPLIHDTVYSPTPNRLSKEKLRLAKSENERLRKEICNMRECFECKVRQTVEHMANTEVELRRRVIELEETVERKEAIIQELELCHEEKRLDQSTIDTLKARIDHLEQQKANLESTNQSMLRRNEVLTQLLAMSPTKSHHGFDFPSPVRTHGRPLSMVIPRLPSSPGCATSRRPRSVATSPAVPGPCCFPDSQTSSPRSNLNEHAEGSRVVDSRLGGSCAVNTACGSSKQSTMACQAFVSPFDLPLAHPSPADNVHMTSRPPFKRRPRKFLPGSTQLKPLLLPTLNGDYSNPPSASPTGSPRRAVAASPSYEDPEPTCSSPPPIASPSPSHVDEMPRGWVAEPSPYLFNDETWPPYQDRQTISPQHETVRAEHELSTSAEPRSEEQDPHPMPNCLAARPCTGPPSLIGDDTASTIDPWPPDPVADPLIDFRLAQSSGPDSLFPSERGLDKADGGNDRQRSEEQRIPAPESQDAGRSSVEIARPLFSPFIPHHVDGCYGLRQHPHALLVALSGHSHPRKRRKADSTSSSSVESPGRQNLPSSEIGSPITTSRALVEPVSAGDHAAALLSDHSHRSTASVMRKTRAHSPLEILQQRHIGARPLAAVSIQGIYGTLSRYTSYFRKIQHDPLALARRVIANAWHANWPVLGRLSWWVLGLFIGPRARESEPSPWNWESYDGEHIADMYCTPHNPEGAEGSSHDPSTTLPSDLNAIEDRHEQTRATVQREGSPSTPSDPRKEREWSIGWGRSLYLWGKFSVAIVLAVGGAVVKGPAEMLREAEDHGTRRRSRSLDDRDPASRKWLTWHGPATNLGARRGWKNRPRLADPSDWYHDSGASQVGPYSAGNGEVSSTSSCCAVFPPATAARP